MKFLLPGLLVFLGAFSARAEEPLYLSFEQRLFLSIAVDTVTSPAARRARLVEAMNGLREEGRQAVEKIRVTSFEQFLDAWRGQWPETNSLSLDLDLILRRKPSLRRSFIAADPALQARVDAYIASQPQKVLRLAQPMIGAALAAVDRDPQRALSDLVESAPAFLQAQSARIEETIGRLMESAFAGSSDPLLRLGMKTVFSRYYSQLGLESKARLATALLGTDLKSDMNGFFSVFLQNSGPQVQKMVQVVARMGTLDPKIAALFKTLENDVKPVPFSQVRDIVAREKGFFDFVSFDEKPLGVGTMAQVHRAVLRRDGRDIPVVVRFLKPGIAARVEEDHRILSVIAAEIDRNPEFQASGVPKLSPLIEEITNTVRAELDVESTIQRQVEAKKAYESTRRAVGVSRQPLLFHFRVPQVYRTADGSQLHVQELVSGRKLETVAEELKPAIPDFSRLLAQETARLWIQEALFGSGFYHSDLHQGNFLIDVRETDITVSLLDYGMSGRLSRDMQEKMLLLSAALSLEKEKLIAEAFLGLSDAGKTKVTTDVLTKAVAEELRDIRAGRKPERGLMEWTAFMMDHGVALSYDLINLNRGAGIIEQMLKETGSAKGFSDISMEQAFKNPVRVAGILLKNGISLKELARLGLSGNPGIKLQTTLGQQPGAVRCEAVF